MRPLLLLVLWLVLLAVLVDTDNRLTQAHAEEFGIPCEDIWHWPYEQFVGADDCQWRAEC